MELFDHVGGKYRWRRQRRWELSARWRPNRNYWFGRTGSGMNATEKSRVNPIVAQKSRERRRDDSDYRTRCETVRICN